jgi:single-stranded-DNA-specific exonuclease
MPLIGENRAIVRHGLRAINVRPLPGLAALIRRSGLSRPWVTAWDIAFKLAPRLNAAGRISEATTTQRLLATGDMAEAEILAEELEALNSQRRELASAALDAARASVLESGDGLPPAIVVSSEHPAGVLGLVAVRLVEETGRPVVVLEKTDGMARGSVRAPVGLSAIEAVTACAQHLIRFGGHAGAAGFSIDSQNVAAFSADFVAAVRTLHRPAVTDDEPVAECRLRASTVNDDLLDLLARIGPFGHGAPEPLFETSGLVVRETRVVGERHLRLKLWGEGRLLMAIAFNHAGEPPPVSARIDLLYRVRPNVWQGQRKVDVEVVGWRPAAE